MYFPNKFSSNEITLTLDDISDGSTYGRVALTGISAGKIVVAGLDSGVTARMFQNGTTKTNIEAWRHASDVTLIDGGDIYTSSITADKISVTNLSAINADLGAVTAGTLSSSDWAAAAGMRLDLSNKILKMGGSNVDFSGSASGVALGLDSGSYKFFVGSTTKNLTFDGTNLNYGGTLKGATAGNIIEASKVAEQSMGVGTTHVEIAKFTIGRGGTYRITWDHQINFAGGYTLSTRVYRDGAGVGEQKTATTVGSYESESDDVGGWSPGEELTLEAWTDYGPGSTCKFKNIRIKTSNPVMTIAVEDDV